jgi:xanthine dehydrogenase accessory factor
MADIYREIADASASGQPAAIAIVVGSSGSSPRKAGAKMLIRADGSHSGTIGGGAAELQVIACAAEVMNSGWPRLMHFDLAGEGKDPDAICGGQMDIFVEALPAVECIVILGAGHIGQNVNSIGKLLGFRIVVVDPRPDFNCRERLPEADLMLLEDYTAGLGKIDINHDTYIVIVTPGHAWDEECLRIAAVSQARYVGMIGSKKKVKEVKEHLLAKGVPKDRLDRVHAPIGLDIGAETPEEIALCILAEIVQVRRSKQP